MELRTHKVKRRLCKGIRLYCQVMGYYIMINIQSAQLFAGDEPPSLLKNETVVHVI